MKNNKEQAVLEFLMTYGLIFLFTIIVILGLAKFYSSDNSSFPILREDYIYSSDKCNAFLNVTYIALQDCVVQLGISYNMTQEEAEADLLNYSVYLERLWEAFDKKLKEVEK